MMTTNPSPHPVDVHVGRRVRALRRALNMSQESLAAAVGTSFQQIQKYERATNRISVSRLFDIAGALDVAPGSFFDGLEQPVRKVA